MSKLEESQVENDEDGSLEVEPEIVSTDSIDDRSTEESGHENVVVYELSEAESNQEPSQQAFHWVFVVLASLVVAAAFAMRTDGGEKVFVPFFDVALPGMCYSKMVLQIDCPGCGLTRCFISCAHGDFGAAFRFNPVGILLFATCVFMIPWNLMQIWRIRAGRQRLKLAGFESFLWVYAALLLIQWIPKVFLSFRLFG